jgi:poly(A) polymerase
MLLKRRCADYDIATDATPHEVRALFPRVLLIGAKFGVAMVLHRGEKVEVTTFRSDLPYQDGRRPTGVRFSNAREDALRRDFTINGMFHDPITRKTIDYVGGREDLARGVIRTIGKPDDRFSEDYLRMLRAVRFAERLEFTIDPNTAAAIRRYAKSITSISGERVFDELRKMLSQTTAQRALEHLRDLGLLAQILPELFRNEPGYDRASRRLAQISRHQDATLSFGAILCELGPRPVRKIIRRWGASNELRDAVCFLSEKLPLWREAMDLPLCDFKRLLSAEHFDYLSSLWLAQEKLETDRTVCHRRITARAKTIAPQALCPLPLLTGSDLREMGIPEGRAVGSILRKVRDLQLNEEITTREEARSAVDRMIRGGSDL